MRLIIVSNRLPVTARRENGKITFCASAGGLATGLNAYLHSTAPKKQVSEYLWIGWPGMEIDRELRDQCKADLLSRYNYCPVFLEKEEIEGFYEGFCNKTIWPLFHYFFTDTQFITATWDQYQRINGLFAAAVMEIAEKDDIIWIHDYHLMLLPRLIRERDPAALIGFFLHIPFPSFEIFRLLSNTWRNDLLNGMLGADVVGFHTNDYAQHFKHCLLKMVGLESRNNKILLDDRIVKVDCFPMNIDFDYFHNTAENIETRMAKAAFQASFNHNRLVLSIDRLDYTKGIPDRLRAFEGFLEQFPEWHNKINLVLVVAPSRTTLYTYQDMKDKIDKLVGKINGKFSNTNWLPVSYQYRQLDPAELVTLYTACDIALITPLRDGMNLIAKEYIASRADATGTLILSEMTGASQELLEAEIVNPYHTGEIIRALWNALHDDHTAQIKKNTAMQKRLKAYNVVDWVEDFLQQVLKRQEENSSLLAKVLNAEIKTALRTRFQDAGNRLLLLDYDGTLVPFAKSPELAEPGPRLLQLLQSLTAMENTTVVMVSGRDRFFLDKWFGSLEMDFLAENGYWIRKKGKWKTAKQADSRWKTPITDILQQYTNRLPGSFLEEKEYSLVWHYRNADAELAAVRILEAIDELEPVLQQEHLHIFKGIKSIEIRGADTSKQNSLYIWDTSNYDFICSFGDDDTDEEIFRQLPPHAFTIKVGLEETMAGFIVRDSKAAIGLMEYLCQKVKV